MFRPLVPALAAMIVSSGCYVSFERAVPGDAALPADAVGPTDGEVCSLLAPTTVDLEPPLEAGHIDLIRLDGFEADPASRGVRFHLDTCPGAESPCPHDAVIGGIGADIATRIRVPPPGATGFLDWDGATTLHFLVIDGRRCASCGGEVEVVAGSLAVSLSAAVRFDVGPVECRTSCGDFVGVTATSHGASATASRGETVQVGPMLLRVTAAGRDPCVRCDCAGRLVPASGLYVSSDGVVLPPG